ncbi:MAG: hypothetical protein U5J63_02390 [Fodinibius sp.]|nr:hypothetical protein [Fodinibius sp.]
MISLLHKSGIGLVLLLLIVGCDKLDTAEVDQQYLQSKTYADFEQEIALEQQRKSYEKAPIDAHLKDFENCNAATSLSLPLTLDAITISKLSNNTQDCIVEKEMMTLKLLAETQAPHHLVRWILIDYKTSYRDQRLVLSAFRDGELRSFRTIGVYKKNLSEYIRSYISAEATANGMIVSTETKRSIQYPIEQDNMVQTNYNIDEQGGITEF